MSKDFFEKNAEYIEKVKSANANKGLRAYVETYGCQQNEADSERIMGMAAQMGYIPTHDKEEASLIVVNTCAIREHAELKVLSNTGQLKHIKEKNPQLIIAVCGCMIQQEHRKEDIKNKYPYVDFVFGTNMIPEFPRLLATVLETKKRGFFVEDYNENPGEHVEGMPVVRESGFKAWVSIMYGCNNFCSYCIVPYVRGRERSRNEEAILSEIKELADSGYRDITLLGQNVNSYGLDTGKTNFASLLRKAAKTDGDFLLRFMTSNPKDACDELFAIMAENDKIAKHLHLPIQSGSDRILKAMNRKYTRDSFMELCRKAREYMPDITITSDIIVGFPGESDEDFEETLDIMRKVRFDAVFSFIYSKRKGTKAAQMEDFTTDERKRERMKALLELQQKISSEKNSELENKVIRALIEGESKTSPDVFSARSEGGKLIHIKKTDKAVENIGKYTKIKITRGEAYALYGELV